MSGQQRLGVERRRLLQLVAAGVLVPGAAVSRALAMSRRLSQGLHRIRGEVRVNGQTATPGQVVGPGDRVATGADSRAVLVIGRDAYLLRADTEVQFEGQAEFADLLRLVSGRLLSVFQPDRGARRILTPVATMGVRGTGLYIEAETSRVYVCTCYGEVELSPNAAPDQAETVRTRHHEAPRYIHAGRTGRVIEPAPVKNHSDAELFMLETLVGREPPFDPSAY